MNRRSIERLIAATPGARSLGIALPAGPVPSAPIARDPSRGGWLVCRFAVGGHPSPWCVFAPSQPRNDLRRKQMKQWMDGVRFAASAAMGGSAPWDGPAEVWINFVFTRGGHHPGDRDNLCKDTTDALQGVVIANDRQVVGGEVRRLWGPVEGAVIEVWGVEQPSI